MFGMSELALILVVAVVVLGAKKLPELVRSAGKASRIFKSEARALKEEEPGQGQGQGARRSVDGDGRVVVSGVVVNREDGPPRS